MFLNVKMQWEIGSLRENKTADKKSEQKKRNKEQEKSRIKLVKA